METWDHNAFPLAHFITFRTYGTWLHGDERGSVDRLHNSFKGPLLPPNSVLENQQRAQLKSPPVKLTARQRGTIRKAIRDVCRHRGWHLIAINIRTNHIHIIISLGTAKPESALRDFKAYSTRALRSRTLWNHSHGPWGEGGSYRYLWKESSVVNACDYVVNEQGSDLPDRF